VCGIVILFLLGCGLVLLSAGEPLWTTGVSVFLGQVNLTQTTGPTEAKAYLSNELLLDNGPLPELTGAVLVPLPKELYSWDPGFPGFARTQLGKEEALALFLELASGHLFASPDGREVLCAGRAGGTRIELAPCQEGHQWRAIHQETRLTAGLTPEVSALQFTFADGRRAEYRLYSANGYLAYSAIEVNELPVDGLLPKPGGSLNSLVARAVLEPVGILWPDLSSAEANARATRLLGGRYRRALEFLRRLESVRAVLGPIKEIRPAEGENYSSSWMDSSEVKLTLLVTGEAGPAVVMIRGDECWAAEMVHAGVWYDLTSVYACPGS
jgi:hypothetical protein